MKRAFLALALSCTVALSAQTIAPKFEKDGDKVKGTYFHENGQISQTGYFVNGKLSGPWQMFDEEGNRLAMGEYRNGKKTGKWTFWEGEMVKEVDFNDNEIAGVVQKNADGVVVKHN